jgi:ADP-ribose pyrophosphatase YjhB (NUDIX family)
LDDAVHREVREECGVEIKVGPLVGTFQLIEHDSSGQVRFHYVVLDYLARHANGAAHPSSDAEDVAWVDPKDLSTYQLRPETVEMIQRALAI